MKNCPIGPVAVLAVVILLTVPVVLGVRLLQKEQAFLGSIHKFCLPHDVVCHLRDVARFAGAAPDVLGRLLGRHQPPTKRGHT
jgi:hypothetical protein